MKQLPFNYDNFKSLHDKAEKQEELIISLSAQLTLAESRGKKPSKKPAKGKES